MLKPAVRDEDGSALIELTWLALLLLLPLVFIMLSAFEVQRGAFGVTAAARAAGRAYALAPSEQEALARAEAALRLALADQGLDAAGSRLEVACEPDPAACLSPGSVISVRVGYAVRLPLAPDVLGGQAPSIDVQAVHRVPYGTFREDRS